MYQVWDKDSKNLNSNRSVFYVSAKEWVNTFKKGNEYLEIGKPLYAIYFDYFFLKIKKRNIHYIMIIILRGHIRNAFETKNLYNLIKEIYNIFPELEIFIHTWNIFANNISWREINTNNSNVNDEIIYDYFDDLKHLIKHIIIDDDTKIQLIGNLSGKINNGPMPIIGWKNYWYSKYKIIDYIYNTHITSNKMIINCRFDIMSNSNNFDKTHIINLIKNNSEINFIKNIFLFSDEKHFGIDNIYIGNINTMYKLINKFFYELDDILSKNSDTIHQEMLVYRINSVLFD
jgi:hypothetical protein